METQTLHLAGWETRFLAWLIDVIILTILMAVILEPVRILFSPATRHIWDLGFWGISGVGLNGILFFMYWTFLEGYKGQSIGKMVLNLRVTDRSGNPIDYWTAAVESLGKAFFPLLIFDCLIGWFAMPGENLRLFNRLSNTIVIRTLYMAPEGVSYVKDKE
ncbi:MAG: RDD family protein [Methanomicrobiales archaeon]|nr:RDD family protein [Methanomicrobiales archaeon]